MPSGAGSIPKLTCPWKMRRLFNAACFPERVASRELSEKSVSPWLAPRSSGEPPGTISERVNYLDSTGRVLAVAHSYRRRDGTLGGSGRPDPKILYTPEGRLDADPSHPDRRRVCPDCT
jgi:hypothetical protein